MSPLPLPSHRRISSLRQADHLHRCSATSILPLPSLWSIGPCGRLPRAAAGYSSGSGSLTTGGSSSLSSPPSSSSSSSSSSSLLGSRGGIVSSTMAASLHSAKIRMFSGIHLHHCVDQLDHRAALQTRQQYLATLATERCASQPQRPRTARN